MGRNYDYEKSEEQAFCNNLTKWARAEGFIVSAIKLNLNGRRGWPDRMLLWEGGNALFIEFKRKGEEPRKLQALIHEDLRSMGFTVEVYDDRHIALKEVQAKIRASALATRGHENGGDGDRIPPIPQAGARQDSSNP